MLMQRLAAHLPSSLHSYGIQIKGGSHIAFNLRWNVSIASHLNIAIVTCVGSQAPRPVSGNKVCLYLSHNFTCRPLHRTSTGCSASIQAGTAEQQGQPTAASITCNEGATIEGNLAFPRLLDAHPVAGRHRQLQSKAQILSIVH